MKHLSLLLIPLILFGQSRLVSPIPLPRTYVLNQEIYECGTSCLEELAEEGQIFSFLAHAPEPLDDPDLNAIRLTYVALFNLGSARQDRLRIALLLPYRVIGRYANSVTNAVFAYMLTKERGYEIRTYRVENESSSTLRNTLREIERDGFYYVIAPVTKEGAQTITEYDPNLTVYFPTIHRNDIVAENSAPGFFSSIGGRASAATPQTIYFGGIDYRAQLDTLLEESVSPLVIFYDTSRLGKELRDYAQERFLRPEPQDWDSAETAEEAGEEPSLFSGFSATPPAVAESYERPKVTYDYAVSKETSNIEHQLKENEKIVNGTFLLNTPIVKSGMIMSQMTLYEANATNILSTQINYDPLIFSMTQYNDRKDMVIANSIGESSQFLVEANQLLGNDIVYDWINYATSIGIDLFYHMITNDGRQYTLPLEANQIRYPVELVSPSQYRFKEYVRPKRPDSAAFRNAAPL